MAQDRIEEGATEHTGRVLATRLDQLHPARDSLVLFRPSPGRAFEHGRRWIHDRDLVASECERNALVPGSATDIDHTPRRTAHVLSQVFVDDVRADTASQGAVMAINETLRQRSPCILGRVVAHVAIVPRDSRAALPVFGSPPGGFEPRVMGACSRPHTPRQAGEQIADSGAPVDRSLARTPIMSEDWRDD